MRILIFRKALKTKRPTKLTVLLSLFTFLGITILFYSVHSLCANI